MQRNKKKWKHYPIKFIQLLQKNFMVSEIRGVLRSGVSSIMNEDVEAAIENDPRMKIVEYIDPTIKTLTILQPSKTKKIVCLVS